jgi:tetratricopeptide (TPR) repeat protein
MFKGKLGYLILGILVLVLLSFFWSGGNDDIEKEQRSKKESLEMIRLKSDIKECEEKARKTKVDLADVLSQLKTLRTIETKQSEKKVIAYAGNAEKVKNVEQELIVISDAYSKIREKLINDYTDAAQESNKILRRSLEVTTYFPSDSDQLFSPSYDITRNIQCWSKDCAPENLNNKEAYADCSNPLSTYLNAMGVKYMEKYVSIEKNYSTPSPKHTYYLQQALELFNSSSNLDPTCVRVKVNLALAHLQNDNVNDALAIMEEVTVAEPTARNWVINGFVQDHAGFRDQATQAWRTALRFDSRIGEENYFGIMIVDSVSGHFNNPRIIREVNKDIDSEAAKDILTFIEFSTVSISNYITVTPDVQEFFIQHQYIILRDLLPPFVLGAVANGFRKLAETGDLPMLQNPNRHTAYNSRLGIIVQYQLLDMARRVVSHNLNPTYNFFSAFVGPTRLGPHTDRQQCEFTIILPLSHSPKDTIPWVMSIGSKPTFIRDQNRGGVGNEPLPPESETIDIEIFPGDGFIYMGRHLVHFHKDPLPDSHFLDQILLHHVPEYYPTTYDT